MKFPLDHDVPDDVVYSLLALGRDVHSDYSGGKIAIPQIWSNLPPRSSMDRTSAS